MRTGVMNWGTATWTAIGVSLGNLLGWVPRLVGGLVVLIVGWIIASILGGLANRALDAVRFNQLMGRAGVSQAIDRAGMRVSPSAIIGKLVKWGVFLLAILVATDALGLPQVTGALNSLIGYIPNVIAAVLILTFGAALASFVGNLVAALELDAAKMLGKVAYWAVMVFAAMAALTQLNIAPALVQTLFTAAVGSVALALAIAFGLGLRHQAEDVAVSAALKGLCQVGDDLTIQNVDGQTIHGTVDAILPGYTTIRNADGTVLLPNRMIARHLTLVHGAVQGPRINVTRVEQTTDAATEATARRPGLPPR